MPDFGFAPKELRVLRGLKTPARIQRFLDTEVAYNLEPDGDTLRSPRRVLRDRVAHCAEGAFLAAAVLRVHGFPPLVMDLEAHRDSDHVLAIFRVHGLWGAIGKSNFAGLRFREPVYRTMRELAMSYFDQYFNLAREKTLRTYSLPVNLARFDRIGWMTAEDDLWAINDYLVDLRHYPVLPRGGEKRLSRVDARLFEAGTLGHSH